MILLCILGMCLGFVSGLLGIGGGILIVPALKYFVEHLGISPALSMHIAVSTSLAVIIFTSSSASIVYAKQNRLSWPLFVRFLPGIIIGVLLGTQIAKHLHGAFYSKSFAILLIILAGKVLFANNPSQHPHSNRFIVFFAIISGILSSIFGIGGGIIMTPFFLYLGLDMLTAIGTSTLLIIPIAVISTLVFGLSKPPADALPSMTGFIYWPAVAYIALGSVIFVPIGAKIATTLAPRYLKYIYVSVLSLIAIKMLIS